MNYFDIEPTGDLDRVTLLRILAIGQDQIAQDKVSDHDALFDRLESEDGAS